VGLHQVTAETQSLMDAVGLMACEPGNSGADDQVCKIPPHLELDRVLSRVYAALRNLP
jgi:hypothetical protein